MRVGRDEVVRVSLLACLGLLSCGGKGRGTLPPAPLPPVLVQAPSSNPLPPPTPAPACVEGALVTAERVCGLGVAGPAYRWDDDSMRDLARQRAATNLAGMMRAVVTSALVVEQDPDSFWSQAERYVEVDENLIKSVQDAADIELWFDVSGSGPFRAQRRTYACACLSSAEAGIRIDPGQASQHALSRQYTINEVPQWVKDPNLHNRSLRCALGFTESTFHPEEMFVPLTESVHTQLVGKTRSWVLSRLNDVSVCQDHACDQYVESIVEAANEGISRGVLVTGLWLDTQGIGPARTRNSAYGWGCVFDQDVLDRARDRIREVQAKLQSER